MKFINKLFLVFGLLIAVSACNRLTDLDINENPNAVTPELADPEFLFNSLQYTVNVTMDQIDDWSAPLARMRAMTTFFYDEYVNPTDLNVLWTNFYSAFLPDARSLEAIATERGLNYHLGATKIMESYLLTSVVDLVGDIPYSEINQGTDLLSPKADDAAGLYATAEKLLDEGIALLKEDAPSPSIDIFYDGDADKWITLANTLKMRIYMNTRLVDSSAGSKFKAIVDGGDFIDEEAEDFQFTFSSNRNNPDSRNDKYASDYEAGDGGYMNNYYMWTLTGEKDVADPRTRFYFYRQDPDLTNEDPNVWDCVLTATPFDDIPPGSASHIFDIDPNLPYCIAGANGYFGRDHGNGQGIPPDGPIRVEWGIYPAGGRWDNNSYEFTQNDGVDGSLGAGIDPYWLASFTDFMRAEMALEAGTGEDARALLESGVTKSLNKVLGWTSIIPAADLAHVVGKNPTTGEEVTAETLLPTDDDVANYVDYVLNKYDSASDKLDVVLKEFYIAMFGNGLEGYNMYRRTGKPNNMQPLLDPQAQSSEFPRSGLYPAVFVERNQTVSQKKMTDQVFWDTNAAGFIY